MLRNKWANRIVKNNIYIEVEDVSIGTTLVNNFATIAVVIQVLKESPMAADEYEAAIPCSCQTGRPKILHHLPGEPL